MATKISWLSTEASTYLYAETFQSNLLSSGESGRATGCVPRVPGVGGRRGSKEAAGGACSAAPAGAAVCSHQWSASAIARLMGVGTFEVIRFLIY